MDRDLQRVGTFLELGWGTPATGARDVKGKMKAISCKRAQAVIDCRSVHGNVPRELVTYKHVTYLGCNFVTCNWCGPMIRASLPVEQSW